MGEKRNTYKTLIIEPEEREQLGRCRGKIILNWILKTQDVRMWIHQANKCLKSRNCSFKVMPFLKLFSVLALAE
jgi:hypothetical protein